MNILRHYEIESRANEHGDSWFELYCSPCGDYVNIEGPEDTLHALVMIASAHHRDCHAGVR